MSMYLKKEDIYLGTIKRLVLYKKIIDTNRGWIVSPQEFEELAKKYRIIGASAGTEEIVEENAVLIKVDEDDCFLNLKYVTFFNQLGIILDLDDPFKRLTIMPIFGDLFVEEDTIKPFYDQEEMPDLSKSTPFQLKREFEQKYNYWKKPL